MATTRGLVDVRRFIAALPADLERKVLRGAARAGGGVIAAEAKDRANSAEVRDAITTKTSADDNRIVVKISVKPGWARSLGIWAEYGTTPHFITVDKSDRAGMSIRRINEKAREGSLVIGGQFVGPSIHHPGAKPHPFLRVSLDVKASDAVAAAQSYIASRVTRAGIVGTVEPEGVDA